MDTCARCGKELKGLLDSHMSHRLIDKKYGSNNKWQGKKLCRACTIELVQGSHAVKTCSICGEKYEIYHSCKGPSAKFLQAKSCIKCGYQEISRIAILIKMDNQFNLYKQNEATT